MKYPLRLENVPKACREPLTVAPDVTYKVLASMVSALVVLALVIVGAVRVSWRTKLPFRVVLTFVTPELEAKLAGTTDRFRIIKV